jgi:hypothetical protein
MTLSIFDKKKEHQLTWEGCWRDVIPTQRTLTDQEKRQGTYQGPSAT